MVQASRNIYRCQRTVPVSPTTISPLYFKCASEESFIEPTLLKPGLTPELDARPPERGRRKARGGHQK